MVQVIVDFYILSNDPLNRLNVTEDVKKESCIKAFYCHRINRVNTPNPTLMINRLCTYSKHTCFKIIQIKFNGIGTYDSCDEPYISRFAYFLNFIIWSQNGLKSILMVESSSQNMVLLKRHKKNFDLVVFHYFFRKTCK